MENPGNNYFRKILLRKQRIQEIKAIQYNVEKIIILNENFSYNFVIFIFK